MKTIVLTCIYPSVVKYLDDFFISLSAQTDRNFEVYVINDGVANISGIFKSRTSNLSIKIRNNDLGKSPAEIRKCAINWVINDGADNIIFGDADDHFEKNRIEVIKSFLLHKNIVFNELVLFGSNVNSPYSILGRRLREGQCIREEDILNSNCIGLSNSGVKSECIKKILNDIPTAVTAFDWSFFTLLLSQHTEAIFTAGTKTYYRQYGNNIASLTSFSDEQIVNGVKVKMQHYQSLAYLNTVYAKKAEIFKKIFDNLFTDNVLKLAYCKAVRSQIVEYPFWWETIKTLEELNL